MKMQPFSPWGGTMTPRERFNAQMHFQPFDRTVNMEFGYWQENYTQWDLFTDNGITNERQADAFFAFEPPATADICCWLHPYFEERVLEEREHTRICLSGEGLICEVPRDGHSTIARCIGASVVTPDDWKRVKEERMRLSDPIRMPDLSALDRLFAQNRDKPIGLSCGSLIGKIRNLLTMEGLCYAVADYPDMVEDMVETICLMVENYLDALPEKYHFDFAAGWEDICCKNGPLVSMDFFKSVIFPRYKRIGNKLHARGIDLWYTDCDGDVRPLLPYFLEAGINCLFPFEVNSCAHPGELLDAYKGALRIMGGVDKIQLIAGKKQIKEYLESLAPYVERGGYIPFCDHRCPPDVTGENYLYYLELKKKMFGM